MAIHLRATATDIAFGDDLGPFVRDPLDLVRLMFVPSVPVSALVSSTGNTTRMLAICLMAWFPRLCRVAAPWDALYLLAMVSWGWGNVLDLFAGWGPYDKVSHVVEYAAVGAMMYAALIRSGAMPEPSGERRWVLRARTAVVLVTFSVWLGACWELFEFVASDPLDAGLRTGYEDTIADLAADMGGAIAGAWGVLAWTKRGRPLCRRPARLGDQELRLPASSR